MLKLKPCTIKGGKLMDYCSICKSRNTWDCEDERETGLTRCDDFKLDFDAIDPETKRMIQNIALASLLLKEE